ncbi:protein of unknown function [Actinoplanes derwentensis]|uniref:DUF4956 domain-containing protein n=2 Tax=Actinoplanes derwentensis TaxID=113562 RepID=A0A1H1QAH7_9ACTN|nr:DUF4956 domain-containing protein [Actinoplanes derwentensis]SDS20521.1 protein of unknown function [Actinoplanes derwentensis]
MTMLLAVAADLVAILVLTFGVYFPRHRRRDLVTAFLGVNIGVLAVSIVLGNTAVGAGLGLGLFGVLSIIRLRSDEISQHEIAYYFAALALGLIAGLGDVMDVLHLGLMALVIAALWLGDHPALFRRHRNQLVRLDVAYTDEAALKTHLETMLGGQVTTMVIKQVDMVNDSTLVEVRWIAAASRIRTELGPQMERVNAR